MPRYVCESCGEAFPARIGLTMHQNRCRKKTGSASRLRDLVAANAAKRKQELKNRGEQPDTEQDFSMDQDYPAPALFDMPLELPAGSQRKRRLPKRFIDHLPSSSSTAVLPTTLLPHLLELVPSVAPAVEPEDHHSANTEGHVKRICTPSTTVPNDHCVYRVYPDAPTDDPDNCLGIEDLCESPNYLVPEKTTRELSLPPFIKNVYAPFKSATTYHLTTWANREVNGKTNEELDELVHGVLLRSDFNLEDLRDYSSKRENDRIDEEEEYEPGEHSPQDSWREGSVRIKLPAEDGKKFRGGEEKTPELEIKRVHYRPLLETVYKVLDDSDGPPFHYTPYKEYWQPSNDSPAERIYGELYSSDVWLEAHEEVQSLPKEDGIENCVLPIMLYSDSTHLSNFGTASLWPIYMYLGGHSKYLRCKLSEAACHHLAYIPSLPASLQETYRDIYGRAASSHLLTHLKRELEHAILTLVLFEPGFLEAYKSGFLWMCTDNVIRRLFLRIMIYSADYPERMLVATLKVMGLFPCATCLTPKLYIHQLGTTVDKQRRVHMRIDDLERRKRVLKARKLIFEHGSSVESAGIKDILNKGSFIPVNNAFSVLAPHGFNIFSVFAPDLLHEFELGVWKAIFTHLLRLLEAKGGDSVAILNRRFRIVPSFGTSTIRHFSDDTAAMKKLAARDFEDILQCSIPVFEDIMPKKHNKIILDLLFVLATWHAYAKLRVHTETTIQSFENSTTLLGQHVRLFKKTTCAEYETRELPKESAARGRRHAAIVKKGISNRGKEAVKLAATRKELNINTPKFHSLGGYAEAIRRFGTTDSYSTQNGEAQHRRVKRLFHRTNRQDAAKDVSKLEGRLRKLRDIRARITSRNPSLAFSAPERVPKTSPHTHYQMSESQKRGVYLSSWANEDEGDKALVNFQRDLRAHILSRKLYRNEDAYFTPDEIDGLRLKYDKIWWHKVLRVNYTTYDLRRAQDSLNPRTHADIMLLDPSSSNRHPYLYGRIIGLFHADIAFFGPGSTSQSYKRMDIVWVRWFQFESDHSSGFSEKRLPQIRFVDSTDPGAFGFLDPECIIRAAHLIPRFSQGCTEDLLPPSIARRPSDNNEDYLFYYVNIFADRDIFMRYRGGGIGHKATWHLNEELMKDILPAAEEEMEEDGSENENEEEEDEDEDEDEGDEIEYIEDEQTQFEAEDGGDEAGDNCEGFADL